MKTIQLLKSPKLKPLGLLIYLQLSACLKVDIFSMHFSDLRLILSLSDQGGKKSFDHFGLVQPFCSEPMRL